MNYDELRYRALTGKASKTDIIMYMDDNNTDSIVLDNDLEIRRKDDDYYVVFDADWGKESIGLQLFLIINRQKHGLF